MSEVKVVEVGTPNEFDMKGLVDDDVLARFRGSYHYGDVLTAQLIKTNKEILEAIKKHPVEAAA